MKKLLFIIFLVVGTATLFSQSNEMPCITCDGNKIDFTKGASAIGTQNESSGVNSLSTGFQNNALGNYSLSAGYKSNAFGDYSMAFGKTAVSNGIQSFAFGLLSEASGNASMAIGSYTLTTESALLSIALGSKVSSLAERNIALGFGLYNDPIENNISNSLMAGFNSNLPSFFISSSDGIGTTGKVGIGNVTNPIAKLHIRADANENATLKLEAPGTNKVAKIILADDDNTITSSSEGNIVFHANNNGHFKFNNGYVGIGLTISNPLHPLQVKGNIMLDGDESSLLFAGDSKTDWGEWGIEYQSGGLNFMKPTGSNMPGNYYLFLADDGNVGIGTESPTEKLEVAGNIIAEEISVTGFRLSTGAGENKVLQSNTTGIATWANPAWTPSDVNIYRETGNVGIGTTDFGNNKLAVAGNIKAEEISVTGFQLSQGAGANKFLQSDASGIASWQLLPESGDDDWIIIQGNSNIYRENGNVGIGTSDPTAQLTLSDIYEAGGMNLLVGNDAYLSDIDQTHTLGILSNTDSNLGAIKLGLQGPKLYGNEGCLGIGTTQTDGYMLAVAGKIIATEINVAEVSDWYDCVFEDDYNLPSLQEVEKYITTNKHLPDVPSENEVKENGINLGQMDALLLKKIEELTLYVLEQQKTLKSQQGEIEQFKARLPK